MQIKRKCKITILRKQTGYIYSIKNSITYNQESFSLLPPHDPLILDENFLLDNLEYCVLYQYKNCDCKLKETDYNTKSTLL